ncbi:TNFAIP3-interacting protein 3 [Rhynchonycteris naso]
MYLLGAEEKDLTESYAEKKKKVAGNSVDWGGFSHCNAWRASSELNVEVVVPGRCESMELDHEIRFLIERNASPGPSGATAGATPSHRSPCPWKTPGETASMAHLVPGVAAAGAAGSAVEHTKVAKPSRGKHSTDSLEQKIRCLEKQRQELLDVNQQWDQQFRSMKELYERKVAELKMKLETTERFLGTLEMERPPNLRDSDRPQDLAQEQSQREEKEQKKLHEELHELRKENKLLKEKNAFVNRKREHYECEIRRLNKALQDALNIECSSFPEDCLGEPERGCSREELRVEMEVLRQQVQIYKEDFQRERSDRERLNQEKEELQKSNQISQSQLNRLKSKIKACRMENEKLEKQLKLVYLPTCRCGSGCQPRDPSCPTGPVDTQGLQKQPRDRVHVRCRELGSPVLTGHADMNTSCKV